MLEIGGGIVAGFASRLLAGFGAEVVAVQTGAGAAETALDDDEAAYLTHGKSLIRAAGVDDVVAIAAGADLVIDTNPPGWIDIAGLRAARPELIWISVTPFGWSGPYRDYQTSPLVSFAMGGIHSLTGEMGREPLHTGGSQAYQLGGLNAFALAVTAWYGRLTHGAGAWFDLSLQELAAGMLELYLPGTSYGMPTQLRTGNHVRAVWGIYPCLDGWAGVFCLERQIPALFAVLDDPELDEARFRDPLQRAEPDNDEVLTAKLYGFFAGRSKAELLAIARERRIPIGVALTPGDLLAAPGLAERGFFDHHGDGTVVPGRPFPGVPWAAPSAPPEVLDPGAAAGVGVWRGRRDAPAPPTAAHLPELPLAGLRVVDLTMMWAGPFATMRLADLGAEVLKIESPSAWDNIRTLVPQPGAATPWNSAYYFQAYNRNKKSVTLDLAQPEGRDLLLALVKHADVLIENYRADVLDNLGLGWDVLAAANPALVVVSMAAFGKEGADAGQVGFGPVIELMSGLASRSGYRNGGGEPFKTGISYGDPVGGTAAVAAVMLGLLQRRRTGTGAVIDLAQREVGATLAGEAFVAASRRGEDPHHRGNRSPRHAPQGVYRAAPSRVELGDACDEQWVALTVRNDEEWGRVTDLLGRADLAGFDLAARQARHDELDTILSDWLRPQDAQAAMERLQAAGVPAGRVLDTGSLLVDPHLQRRGFFLYPPHPLMHRHGQCAPGWRSVEAPPTIRSHAPLFGEHNAEILGGLLGLSPGQLDQLAEQGVIGDEPINPGVG